MPIWFRLQIYTQAKIERINPLSIERICKSNNRRFKSLSQLIGQQKSLAAVSDLFALTEDLLSIRERCMRRLRLPKRRDWQRSRSVVRRYRSISSTCRFLSLKGPIWRALIAICFSIKDLSNRTLFHQRGLHLIVRKFYTSQEFKI